MEPRIFHLGIVQDEDLLDLRPIYYGEPIGYERRGRVMYFLHKTYKHGPAHVEITRWFQNLIGRPYESG